MKKRVVWALLLLVVGIPCLYVSRLKTRTLRHIQPSTMLTDKSKGYLLTWVDTVGAFHLTDSVAKIPVDERECVRVQDPDQVDKIPPEQVLLADTRTARADGTYPIRFAPRVEFEQWASKRKYKLSENIPSSLQKDTSAGHAVTLYGASWCGACRQVSAYLQDRNIQYIEKDIEQDPSAVKEMQEKLQRAGIRGGAIPVLDIGGSIQIGFSPQQIEEALSHLASTP